MFMNVRTPPFDDPKVREAVNYGLDKPALARIFARRAGPRLRFLPPGMPGYDEAFDTTDCPYGDPTKPPDLDEGPPADQAGRRRGREGHRLGQQRRADRQGHEAYADTLNEIGLDADVKILDAGVYFQTIGNENTEAQTGFTNWFQDFPHPLNFYFLVDGSTIQPTNNQNFGNIDDPHIN